MLTILLPQKFKICVLVFKPAMVLRKTINQVEMSIIFMKILLWPYGSSYNICRQIYNVSMNKVRAIVHLDV